MPQLKDFPTAELCILKNGKKNGSSKEWSWIIKVYFQFANLFIILKIKTFIDLQ